MPAIRVRWALIAFAILFGQSAEAQLFPNLFIRRSRPACDSESASVKMHRDHYYGYQPTEWRRFPEGWGYRHPEVIDRAALMKEVEDEVKKLDEEYGSDDDRNRDDEMDENLPPRGGRNREDNGGAVPRPIPLPDDSESPFNLEAKPANPGGANPPADRQPTPAAPELPKPGDSPFDIPGATPNKPADDLPPRPRTNSGSPVGMIDSRYDEVAVVEAPAEVMRAPQRNVIRDRISSLNPLGLLRR
jgi:hypothetical protein